MLYPALRIALFPNPVAVAAGAGFSTDFTTGAQSDPLSNYAGWVATSGSWAIDALDHAIAGLKCNTIGAEHYATKDSTLVNGTFTLVLESGGTASVPYPSLVIRYLDDNNFIRLVGSAGSNTFRVQQCVAGSFPLDFDTTVAFAVGNVYTLALVASGTSVQAKINGSNAGAAQTVASTSNTKVGMSMNAAPDVVFRSVSAA